MNGRNGSQGAAPETTAKRSESTVRQTTDNGWAGAQAATDLARFEVLPKADAKRLTLTIKLLAGSIADQIDKVTELIGQARSGQADVALGYKSWTAYCAAEFAGSLPRLERQARQELVVSLTEQGMSLRAIAPIVGVSHPQVIADRRAAGQDLPPDDDVIDAELVDTPVVGRDGKTYNVPPPKRHRRPLPDAYRYAIHDLTKAIDRLNRLHEDDRFGRNRKALNGTHWREIGDLAGQLDDLHHHLFSGRHLGDTVDDEVDIEEIVPQVVNP